MPDVDAPIELHISDVTTDDLVDAFLVRDRHLQTPLRRWGLRLGILAAMLTLAYLAQTIVGSPGLGLINAGIYLYVGALSLLCRPKRLYRMTSRRLVRDNPDLFGAATVTITDAGLQRRTATGRADVGWEHYKLYAESDASFVLFLSDRPAAAVELLPKRALTAVGDVERLRTLLDRHVRCVTQHRRETVSNAR
jgi:hypothetical protein